MTSAPQIFELVRHPLAIRTLRVIEVERLTPKMRRIILGGAALAGFRSLAAEDHVKVFFPQPGEAFPALPRVGKDGRIVGPSEGAAHARDYTPVHFDGRSLKLSLDFFLHGQGIAARWATTAEPGAVLGVAGPRGSYVLREHFERHVFVGDETALPEMQARIARLGGDTRVDAVFLIHDAHEEQALPSYANVTWVHRAQVGDRASAALVEALSQCIRENQRGFFWLAGEANQVRDVQRFLRERNIERSHIHSSGHWKRGAPNHDHHAPIEP